jgi:hypothetical protein
MISGSSARVGANGCSGMLAVGTGPRVSRSPATVWANLDRARISGPFQ